MNQNITVKQIATDVYGHLKMVSFFSNGQVTKEKKQRLSETEKEYFKSILNHLLVLKEKPNNHDHPLFEKMTKSQIKIISQNYFNSLQKVSHR